VLDMPVNTVKTTLRRALARLREKAHNLELEINYGSARRYPSGNLRAQDAPG